ncbi:MAG: septal ring lytic transglycosylase RlpA family protein [Xanthobacteraceae bacterium]
MHKHQEDSSQIHHRHFGHIRDRHPGRGLYRHVRGLHRHYARSHQRHYARHHPTVESGPSGSGQSGIASVYAYSGERTANGQRATPSGLTAAHRSLPFGTLVRVTNQHNGRSVVVRINDRGPFVHGRVIDLTPAGAHALGFDGLAPVTLAVVGRSA